MAFFRGQAMSTPLQKRLQALEALPPKIDPEHDRRFSAAIETMLDTVNFRNEWARSKLPPFTIEEQPSDLDALWQRIKSKTTTKPDRALMDSWPKCHLEPAQLVEGMAHIRNRV